MDQAIEFTINHKRLAIIKGVHSSRKSGGGSIDFLSRALACIGVPVLPKTKIGIDLGQSILFSFDGITSKGVDASKITKVVTSLNLKTIPSKQLENGDVHIAYEYLYAKKLLMARADSGWFTGDVAGKIGKWVNLGSAKVDVQVQNQTAISFEVSGRQPAPAFAYKAGQLLPENGALTFRVEVVKAGPAGESLPYIPNRDQPLNVVNVMGQRRKAIA
ncbi:MAG: hypothetical protein JOY98_00120 [Candidatus Eremiobacteraeota bacterium]|nr:hypothetical protein [Candidatus Eremiobacteraeota bacterium]